MLTLCAAHTIMALTTPQPKECILNIGMALDYSSKHINENEYSDISEHVVQFLKSFDVLNTSTIIQISYSWHTNHSTTYTFDKSTFPYWDTMILPSLRHYDNGTRSLSDAIMVTFYEHV